MEEISDHRGNNRRSTDSFERAVCHHIRQRVSGSGLIFCLPYCSDRLCCNRLRSLKREKVLRRLSADAKAAGVSEEFLKAFRTQVESTIRMAPCGT